MHAKETYDDGKSIERGRNVSSCYSDCDVVVVLIKERKVNLAETEIMSDLVVQIEYRGRGLILSSTF